MFLKHPPPFFSFLVACEFLDTDVNCLYREMAVGNTFGATALSSYGGFWITYGIILTPGGFGIVDAIKTANGNSGLQNAQAFWLIVRLFKFIPPPPYPPCLLSRCSFCLRWACLFPVMIK